MSNEELKNVLDYCLNVKECTKCNYAEEKECMLSCTALIKECLSKIEKTVEVVRCKDCKLRYTEGCPFMSWDCSGELMGDNEDTDFCSYGERKDHS